ncbi:hypothetical protein [Tropicibacter sp. S64]|uniref:hypothetical protein n=1 Tax=Tropicibacter sp. S64 TaxID=3415122 RepID=UPI003C7C7A04
MTYHGRSIELASVPGGDRERERAAMMEVSRQRRALVDLVAESRSRAVRVALFGTLLHRPDPDGRERDADREHNLKVLKDTVRWLDRAHEIVNTLHDPWEEYSDETCKWLRRFIEAESAIVPHLDAMARGSQRVVQAADRGGAELGTALQEHYELRRGQFMPVVTRFCDTVWRDIDERRDAEVEAAAGAVAATQQTLKRMETISKHVRLVAINAAIEASKLGDLGRGIGFIASEFKTLAEELQMLSSTALREMEGLSK